MKKRKINQKGKKIKKVSLSQEQAEVYQSVTHLVSDLNLRRNENTPDFLDLNLKHHHFVFVYGTLKSGERNTFLLDGCPFLGEGFIAVKNWNMKLSKGGNFPIIFDAKTEAEKKTAEHVWGEIYVVDPLKMLELDQLESNGVMYQRTERWVWLEDQRIKDVKKNNLKPAEKCWVYIGNPLYWQGREMVDVKPTRMGHRSAYIFSGEKVQKVNDEKVKHLNNEVFNTWAHGMHTHDDDYDMYNQLPF